MLERRLTRLENKLKIPKEQRHVCEGGLSKAKDVFIEGSRVKHVVGTLVLDRNLKPVGRSQAQVSSLTQAGGSTQPLFPRASSAVDEKLGVKKEVRVKTFQNLPIDPRGWRTETYGEIDLAWPRG